MLRPPSSDDRPATASQPVGGTADARTDRLAQEYRRLARDFAFHPFITIIPIGGGNPPETYQVEFRVRTVIFEKAERKLHYVDNVTLVLAMDAGYPESPPVVHPPEGLFLPNADDDRVQIDGAWHTGDWLADLIPRLGEMLAHRTHDPDSVLNDDAMNWQEANVKVLPTDKARDFTISAGGSPGERIARYAAARIAEVRRVLETTCNHLADGEIDPDGVRDITAQAKYVLLPVLQDTGDPAFAASAKELTAWVNGLADSLPAWYELRERRSRLASAQRAMDGIAKSAQPLSDALAELSAMFTETLAKKPAKALGQLPLAAVLTPLVSRFSTALAGSQEHEAQARKALADFADFDASHPPSPSSAPQASPVSNSPVGKLLAERQSAVGVDCEQFAARAGPALEQMVDLLRRGRAETTALQRLADWRGYLDEFIAGSELAREVLERGPTGVQAYVLESLGQIYGPYQFEQAVTFGPMQLAIGRDGDKLQIIDASTGELAGSRAAASISLRIPVRGGEATLSIHAAADCAATAARLDSARTRTFELLSRLHDFVAESQSWCGRLLQVLCDPAALAALHAEHRRSAHRWDRLAADLLLLAPLKDRLATFNLVQRSMAAAKALAEKRTAAEKKIAAASEKLAALAARCDRDPNTDKLLIPPQLAEPYSRATAERQSATKETQRIDRRERTLAEYAGARLVDPARIGRANLPTFRRLGALSPELSAAATAASDNALTSAVSALAKQLRVTFPAVVASNPVDLSARRREKRASDATADPFSNGADANQSLALRPEDSMADVAAITDEMESEGE